LPLTDWAGRYARLEDVPRGLSRHPVVFVNESSALYALKEMAPGVAEKEYQLLQRAAALHLPVVVAQGHARVMTRQGAASILITRYLEGSLPYRMLFMRQGLAVYRGSLLDAIAGLLVQLHLAGVYWGDCSLSNTLFRRDAGALRAYLVDAETTEIHSPGHTPPVLRLHDLQIMEENINGEIVDLISLGLQANVEPGVPLEDSVAYIRVRYQRLWEEITREVVINAEESFRIQEHIRALNHLGFSVGDVELNAAPGGAQLHLRAVVTDRNFHRDQLTNLTGLDAEEFQAQKMMNEIHEVRAMLSQSHNRSVTLSAAAYHWLENIYLPVAEQLGALANRQFTPAELYCQVLEHKWYLSERAQRDVGHQAAAEDYMQNFWVQERLEM
jgi:hypothetical protein